MHSQPKKIAPRGFTMVEILIVIAIIVILAGIVVAIAVGVTSAAKEKATKATFERLDSAMSLFLKDHPEPTDANWVVALKSYGPSGQLLKNDLKTVNGNDVVLDGWGSPIHYLPSHSTAKNLPTGMFQSYGRDLQANTADDRFSNGAAAAQ